MSLCRVLEVLVFWVALGSAADDATVRDALAALRRGDYAVAEQSLRAASRAHPNDGGVLTLLGVALDSQNKTREAEAIHRRALATAPNSPDVVNNYANHLLNAGDEVEARKLYLRVTMLDAGHNNANIQLARLAIKDRNGLQALGFLKHVPGGDASTSPIAPLRLAALYQAGDKAAADALAADLSTAGKTDLRVSFSTGMVLADAGQFAPAERFLSLALALAPSDFNVLSNLAVVASHEGDHGRARELLATALRLQPQNVDVLYRLAYEHQTLRQVEAAVGLLARAARLAPERADVQKLLALAASDLGALEDAAAAWDRYLKLTPADDAARRERGYLAVQMGHFEQGVAELQWFVARHPDDAVGHYELGMAVVQDDPAKALAQFDRALALKPDYVPAHAARGSLYYQMGKPEAAVSDLETAAALQPGDAANLDRLGQSYLALDRPADAVKVLRKAAELAPDDSKTQLHFARALEDAGLNAESKLAMERFRQLGPSVNKSVPAGLVDYLSLTPEQRRADYRARVEKQVREHPEDAAAQVSYVKLLLDDGRPELAVQAARRVAALKPYAALLADAGRALLEAKQYQSARALLEQAAAARAEGVTVDVALAAFHAAGAAEGLRELERVPEPQRTGDELLARALILYASGRNEDAGAALENAMHAVPRRTELYRQAVAVLLTGGREPDALRLLVYAGRALSQDREIALMYATVLELAGQSHDAEQLLSALQGRWPEWAPAWAAHGMVLAMHSHFDEARRALETAAALGAHSPELRACLAESAAYSVPARFEIAEGAVREALASMPNDVWLRELAGRIGRRDLSGGSERPPYLRHLLEEKAPRDW